MLQIRHIQVAGYEFSTHISQQVPSLTGHTSIFISRIKRCQQSRNRTSGLSRPGVDVRATHIHYPLLEVMDCASWTLAPGSLRRVRVCGRFESELYFCCDCESR